LSSADTARRAAATEPRVRIHYERGAILLTSNQSLGAWGEVVGDAVIATAILDRFLHHATSVNINGDAYRLREKRRAGLMKSTPTHHSEA
jgi:DNA replication protein DnaC